MKSSASELGLTKHFYEGDISIPWQLVTQLAQESLDISDAGLCENVGEVFQVMPNAGETYIIGLYEAGECVFRGGVYGKRFLP